jgi:hypothetical protein
MCLFAVFANAEVKIIDHNYYKKIEFSWFQFNLNGKDCTVRCPGSYVSFTYDENEKDCLVQIYLTRKGVFSNLINKFKFSNCTLIENEEGGSNYKNAVMLGNPETEECICGAFTMIREGWKAFVIKDFGEFIESEIKSE